MTSQPSHPDKIGTLIQCRELVNSLDKDEIERCAIFTMQQLTSEQLKTMLFVGLNHIKSKIDYPTILKIKQQFYDAANLKQKKLKSRDDIEENQEMAMVLKVPPNASLTKTIPQDIITFAVCKYLDLLSIYQFSKCDRISAIATHSPNAIQCLQFHYLNSYRYCSSKQQNYFLDANHLFQRDIHSLKNAESLSVVHWFDERFPLQECHQFTNVKHLSLYGFYNCLNGACWKYHTNKLNALPIMPLLRTVTFESFNLEPIIYWLQTVYKRKKK
eukprot:204572_1